MSDYPYPPPANYEQPYGPLATFRERGLIPPTAVYITQDDTIQLRSWAPTGNQTVRVTLRVLNNDGIISTNLQTITVVANGATSQVNTIQGDEGFLLSASVDCDAIQRGLCFVQLVIRRGVGSSDTQLGQVIVQGYPYLTGMLAFPQSPIENSIDGRGAIRLVTGTDPAAGAEISETVPAGREWILRSLSFGFTASAVVANRSIQVVFDDGTATTFAETGCSTAVTAGQALQFSLFPFTGQQVVTLTIQDPLARELRLPAGFRIRTVTNNLDVGDNYSAPRMYVEEFISQ